MAGVGEEDFLPKSGADKWPAFSRVSGHLLVPASGGSPASLGLTPLSWGASDLKYKFPHFVRACRGQPGPALVSHVRKVRLREGKSLPQGHTKKQLRAGLERGLLDAVFASHHPALQAEFHTFLAQLAHRSVFPTLTGSYTDRQTTC